MFHLLALMGFPKATARFTARCACLWSAVRSFIIFCPVRFAFAFSPIPPPMLPPQVSQAYPQLASKELTFGFKVIYKDMVRRRRLLLLFASRNCALCYVLCTGVALLCPKMFFVGGAGSATEELGNLCRFCVR